jgi:hypothetical protein
LTIAALLLIVAFITLQQGINHDNSTTRWFWLGVTLILVWKALSIPQ